MPGGGHAGAGRDDACASPSVRLIQKIISDHVHGSVQRSIRSNVLVATIINLIQSLSSIITTYKQYSPQSTKQIEFTIRIRIPKKTDSS